MLTSKKTALKPLLESNKGVHLTAYLVNRGDISDLKSQLRTTLDEAYEWLYPAMTSDQQKKFLEPLESLLSDASIFEQMKGNIGLFRNEDSFRVLNVPVDVERSCQVATSFHVKPLLRWLQFDRDFLLMGFEKDSTHLYFGNQDSFKIVDSWRTVGFTEEETYTWARDWISELTKYSKPKLFLAGEKKQVAAFNRRVRYAHTVKSALADSFGEQNVSELCQNVRSLLKAESRSSLERALLEFKFAEQGNRTRKNIFQIAKAVVQGRVRKLVVTDELNIFGKIDLKSGGLALHPFDLDHEDDDILDDLAQMVLSRGGEVVVAKRNEIPNGRPILAILDDDEDEAKLTDDRHQFEMLQERFG